MLKAKLRYVLCILVLGLSMIALIACDDGLATYNLYYKNTAANKLISQEYKTATTEQSLLIDELIDNTFKTIKKDDCVILKPADVILERYSVSNNVIQLYFNKEYDNLSNSDELLLRAGLVKVVTQVPGIEYVRFYVDNAPATYEDGSRVGLMSPADFVDDSDEKLESVEWKPVTLYYANKLGNLLVSKQETIAVGKSISVERILVEMLIKGVNDSNMSNTLPADLKVLGVSVSERICYVNLSSAFLTDMVNVSNEIPIYSIVNTLCSLDSIDSVKLLVNGDSSKNFRESISLDTVFAFNGDLIEY